MNMILELDELDRKGNRHAIIGLTQEIITVALEQEKPDIRISHNNETGQLLWSVEVDGTSFWLDSFATKDEAMRFCEINQLKIVSTSNPYNNGERR